jgi:hypothetical protein
MWPGMIPTLHFSPGEMMPGQLGPMRRVSRSFRNSATRTMSSVGTPSVMQHDERNARVRRLHDCVRRAGGRHEDHRDVRARALHGLGHAVEDRETFDLRPALAGVTPPTTLVP